MTITTWPIDAVAAVPGRQLREAHSVYMAGASAADPFGVCSGVRPGTSPTTVTATSTTWTVGAHAGVVDLQPAVEASGYAYSVNATGGLPSGPVTAADLTRPRVDIVWVRNDDPSEGDASPNPTVVFGYTAGAPLAIPVAPATPARCMVLATLQVPMSGGGSPTVIWVAPYTVGAGGLILVRNATERGLLVPYAGMQIYRLDLNCIQTYDGTRWFTRDSFIGGDRYSTFGSNVTDLDTPKIRLDYTTVLTTGPGGNITAPYTTAFPNGVMFYSLSPVDSTAGLATVIPEHSWASLTQCAGIGYTKTGVALASGLSVNVAVQAVGW